MNERERKRMLRKAERAAVRAADNKDQIREILDAMDSELDELMEALPERERSVIRAQRRFTRVFANMEQMIENYCLHEMQAGNRASDEAVIIAELLHKLYDVIEGGVESICALHPWLKGEAK